MRSHIKSTKVSILVAVLTITFIFIAYPGGLDNVVKSSARAFSLSDFSATILVDKLACDDILAKHDVVIENFVARCKNGSHATEIKGMTILWRGSKEYYLQFSGRDGKKHTLTVPAKHILSISK